MLKHIAAIVMIVAVQSALGAEAKDSEAASKLRPRGDAAPSNPAPLAPKPGSGEAGSDGAGQGANSAETPKASPEAPRSMEGAANAMRGGGGYTAQVCNKSDTVAAVAVTRRNENGRGWWVEGWWRIEPSDCRTIGNFPRGNVYYYAEADGGGTWAGEDVGKCVRYPGPFSRLDDVTGERYDCRRDERVKWFTKYFIADDIGTHTWNLNP